jgi:hypothetical protein
VWMTLYHLQEKVQTLSSHHSPLCRAEIKNEWRWTSATPVLRGVNSDSFFTKNCFFNVDNLHWMNQMKRVRSRMSRGSAVSPPPAPGSIPTHFWLLDIMVVINPSGRASEMVPVGGNRSPDRRTASSLPLFNTVKNSNILEINSQSVA